MDKKIWYETDHYAVTTGESSDPANPGRCYHSTNKDTGVVELESKIFPQIIDFTDQLTEHLNKPKAETPPKTGEVIPFAH